MIPKDFITEWRDRAPWVLDRQVEQDLAAKKADPNFTADMTPLLAHGRAWDFEDAFERVWTGVVARLPGDPWRSN